jgi:DnaJ-class molecular chaperone
MKNGVTSDEESFDGFCYHGDSYATFLNFFGNSNPFFEELSQNTKVGE